MNDKTILSQEEASNLAEELKQTLKEGFRPEKDEKLIKKLIAGLGDNRGMLRRTFSESLGAIGPASIPELREALLKSPNVTTRRAAAKTLKLVGDPSALPDLLEALINDKDPVVQGSSAGAIAIFGEHAIEYFVRVLERPNSSEMQCGLARWGLSFIGAKGANSLKEAALSKNPKVRASCIAALGEQTQTLCDLQAKNIITNALNDVSIEVQIEAIRLIGALNEEDWDLDLLASKLSHINPQVRKQTALSLMRLKASNQIERLRNSLLNEDDAEVINILELSIKVIKRNT
ncbi:HEAT repeat domain-containing protein [Prochlorococcus marinus]|uniref:HEAT repeat domain-containing protein n=1 Tax=Prochlorococcus marinus TaxID=1219 RepID=UPI0005336F75|nr:Bilin biosynthesis protein MpeU [Prochlorococcus marinus str. SS2]KGG22975.1 Bilin biosynthesis protein MpeU [Prochlorococcus marinus str. SS35]